MYRNITVCAATIGLILFSGATKTFASSCSNQYGGTEVCTPTDLNLNKQVQDPVTGLYVENITTPKFSQGNAVNFKIIIKNNAGETFRDLTITDTVPENLVITDAYTTAPGEYTLEKSSDNKGITLKVPQLVAGAGFDVYVMTKLVGTYPTGDSFCRDNWAKVTSPARPDGDTNFARFCVAQGVGGTTTLPTAGVNDLVMIVPLVAMAGSGLAMMRRK